MQLEYRALVAGSRGVFGDQVLSGDRALDQSAEAFAGVNDGSIIIADPRTIAFASDPVVVTAENRTSQSPATLSRIALPRDEGALGLARIALPHWGRVVAVDGSVPCLVVDDAGVAVEPICRYLGDLAARRRSASSTRSYAYELLRWWRWLRVIGIDWDQDHFG